jgi:phospholipid transport system substrate-binding protein
MKKLFIAGFLLFAVVAAARAAATDSALDTVKARVGEVLAVLRDPALKADSAKEAKKSKLRSIFDNIFDYNEMSKSTLSRNWDKLTPAQQKEFVTLYKSLLENFYSETILSYKDQQVTFGKERPLGENRYEVETKVTSGSTETPINFRLVQKDGRWAVYDFSVEGIGVVANYRSQFGRILTKESPDSMLANLRKQVADKK